MKYNKLVRDKILEVIRRKGGRPVTHIADEAEYWIKLKEKLQEEVDEFKASENIEEIADMLEVIEAICEYKDFPAHSVDRIKTKKATERGKFAKRIILDEA